VPASTKFSALEISRPTFLTKRFCTKISIIYHNFISVFRFHTELHSLGLSYSEKGVMSLRSMLYYIIFLKLKKLEQEKILKLFAALFKLRKVSCREEGI
jgi:hypothetical protein